MAKESYDHLEIRCWALGGLVTFKYCRTMNQKKPCEAIINCWQDKIEIMQFLSENFLPEDPLIRNRNGELKRLSELLKEESAK